MGSVDRPAAAELEVRLDGLVQLGQRRDLRLVIALGGEESYRASRAAEWFRSADAGPVAP